MKADNDRHFYEISSGAEILDNYTPSKWDEFIVTELDLANKREEVEHRTVKLAELCAFLAESTDKPAARGTF